MNIRNKLRIRTRLRRIAQRVRPPKSKPLILMYHRIADDPIDRWGLSVSPDRFEEHLRVLRRTRHPLPLSQFVKDLAAGTLRPDAVALTFDDGYVDNLIYGKPRLASADVPATVFLATGYLDRPNEFWWDELARLILLEGELPCFELVARGTSSYFDLGSKPVVRKDGTVNAASLIRRQAVLTAIWQTLQRMDEPERELAMTQVRSICSVGRYRTDRGRAMTREEVRYLTADGLVTIGAHTVTHPILSELDEAHCAREIAESKAACEALTEAPVTGFAYPYGDLNERSRNAVVAAGYAFACAARYEPVVSTSDFFALPRIHVRNWNGDAFDRALRLASASIRANFPRGVSPKLSFSRE